MTAETSTELTAYIAGLTRVRAAAGVLFTDVASRVMVVQPTYKVGWEIPGGALEPGESPAQACRRELAEELGIDHPAPELLCVDWVPPAPPWDGGLMFVFDGGVLDDDAVAAIRLNDAELAGFEFVDDARLDELLVPRLASRIRVCLQMRKTGAAYLENGHPLT